MQLVLCDDERILGEALAVALEARGHRVLAVTTTPADGVAAVAAHHPDICLLDLSFEGHESGLDAARAICQDYPGTSVVVLSGIAGAATLSKAVEAGVAGFIRKDQNVAEIAHVLDVVAAGGAVFNPGLLRDAVTHPAARSKDPLRELTQRETEILTRIAGGESTRQMARAMGVTTNTIRTYVKNMLAKLGAHSRLQAAAIARREGLLDRASPGDRPPAARAQPPIYPKLPR
jgi:two-component system, NarL family, nitrate/nitrite response regulator NarL